MLPKQLCCWSTHQSNFGLSGIRSGSRGKRTGRTGPSPLGGDLGHSLTARHYTSWSSHSRMSPGSSDSSHHSPGSDGSDGVDSSHRVRSYVTIFKAMMVQRRNNPSPYLEHGPGQNVVIHPRSRPPWSQVANCRSKHPPVLANQ